jgi:RHS repeat-associated protein
MAADGTAEQVNHYYAFGGLLGMSTGSSVLPYKYNGKELDRSNGLDLYDYGARWYDAALGRWLSMDPHGESYQQTSPFAYCKNDPVNAIDPDGRDVYYMQNGQFAFKNTAETDNIYIISKYEYGKELENGNRLVSVWNRRQ